MNYLNPDERWEIFGFLDFESYCASCVFKGNFHSSVPNDVKDSYAVAEYMMAHAYYHYPLYDEALSKILRIVEMAVKLRCVELQITPTQINKKGEVIKKNLNSLINELNELEPSKQIKGGLHFLRSIRNRVMHPERHTFSGLIAKNLIVSAVNLFNKIFMTEGILKSFHDEVIRIQNRLSPFANQILVLESDGKKYLIEKIEITSAVVVQNKWIYLMVLYPIPLNIKTQIANHSYSSPFIYDVHDLKIESEIICRIINDNKLIHVSLSTNSDDLTIYKAFKNDIDSNDEEDKLIYIQNTKIEIAKDQNRFLYRYLALC